VYTSWASHCDDAPYTGWVIGYDEHTLAQTSVFDFTPNGNEGSVWMAGAGPAADANGYIYFLAANGTFDTDLTNGFPSHGDYGNAFLKLSVQNTQNPQTNLAVVDYFTMANTVNESIGDVDLGSGGALVLPDMTDSHGVTRHLAVGAGKDQHIYLVDRDNMGKFQGTDNNYQDLVGALPGGEWAMPAYFNGYLYYGGVNDVIKAYQFSNATLVTPPAFTSTTSFGYPGTTPSISASSSKATNPIIWAVENSSTATLHAYGMDLNELYNSNQAANGRDNFGGGNKFITPTIANGKVYVGTPTGVGVLGILPANLPPVITSPLTASATVGKPFSYQITASHNPTSYSASGLPAGLLVNTATGRISGTPQSAGTATITIGATNASGTGTAKLVLTIKKKH